MHSRFFLISLLCFSTVFAFAQMTPREGCSQNANPDWYALGDLATGEVLDTRIEQFYWIPDGHATSLLPAEGNPPDEGEFENTEEPALGEFEYLNALATWRCMYGPQKAVDGDPQTAWSEGVDGSGVGEILIVGLGNAQSAEIWTGFGRSERLHKRNGRPERVEVIVLQALTGLANQFDLTAGHFVVLARDTARLEDFNGFQPLPLPAFERITDRAEQESLLRPFFDDVPTWAEYQGSPEDSIFIAIRILSVYAGTTYEDTLISEVRAR